MYLFSPAGYSHFYLASEGQCKAMNALMNSLQGAGMLMVNKDECLS